MSYFNPVFNAPHPSRSQSLLNLLPNQDDFLWKKINLMSFFLLFFNYATAFSWCIENMNIKKQFLVCLSSNIFKNFHFKHFNHFLTIFNVSIYYKYLLKWDNLPMAGSSTILIGSSRYTFELNAKTWLCISVRTLTTKKMSFISFFNLFVFFVCGFVFICRVILLLVV